MKTKMKWVMVMLMVSSLLLSACGGNKAATNDTKDAAPAATVTKDEPAATADTETASTDKLIVAIWDTNQEPGLTQIIADFTAATGIEAEIQVTPWDQYWTMLEAGATGGALPDVFWMHSNEIARYSEYELLLDLSSRIEKSTTLDMSKFPKEITDIYKWDGTKQYAIPKDIDTIALWYNKTMFDAAGVSYPDASWTWDDFANACAKLTKDDGSQFGYGLSPGNNQDGWYNIVYDMGGKIISDDKKSSGFDMPGTIKAIDYITSIVKNGNMPSYEAMSENSANALFEAGKVAMITQGSWMLAELCNNDYVKANCDVAVLPKDVTSGRRASIYNGLGWAAAANTKNPDAAWALIEYFGSKEAQQKQSDLGIVISAYEGTVANWTAAYPDFNVQAYLDMMSDLVIRPYSKSTVRWENMATEKLVQVWTGEKTAEAACTEIAAEMNALLKDE